MKKKKNNGGKETNPAHINSEQYHRVFGHYQTTSIYKTNRQT